MPEALQGFIGFLAILAVIAAIVFVIIVVMALNEARLFIILLNAAVALIGLAVIITYAASPFGWLIGSAMLALGGFNLRDMIPNLIKHGNIDGNR